MEHHSSGLVASIREKNSRNIEKFGDKAIMGSNSKMEVKECNSQYLINSDSIKGDSITHNMSFDVNHRGRVLKSKKKKEEANKALLNFEDMKRKILKDYVKKNNKELSANVAQPSHHRNGAGVLSNYFSQIDDSSKRADMFTEAKSFSTKDEDFLYLSEGIGSKKKTAKKSNSKSQFMAIYDGQSSSQWNNPHPLTQKSINENGGLTTKERPSSNKRHTPSKKQGHKSSSKWEY